jgi:hypothetical protein
MIAKRYKDGRYTVVSANGILVLQLPENEAIAALRARGLSDDRARAVLSREVPAAEWRSTFIAATAATAAATAAAVDQLPDAVDVSDVRERQEQLGAAVAELRAEVATGRREQERHELEKSLNSRAEQMIEVAEVNGIKRSRFLEQKVWENLWQSPEGLRLAELRNED